METAYLVCALIGSSVIVCQFILTVLGLGGHHDVGGGDDFAGHDFGGHDVGGHDVGGHDHGGHAGADHHEVGHGQEPSWFFTYLTFRTLSAAVAFFGLAGLAAKNYVLEDWQVLIIAVAAGSVAMVLVAKLMKMLGRLNVDGTVRIEHAIGSRGTVYLSIPGKNAGVGKVHVSQSQRLQEYKAITKEETLPTGAKVVVVGVVTPDTVEVASVTESARVANV